MTNSIPIERMVEVKIVDNNHCSEDCNHISVNEEHQEYHYCWMTNSRGLNRTRSAQCKQLFGNKEDVHVKRKRRSKAEMESAKSE